MKQKPLPDLYMDNYETLFKNTDVLKFGGFRCSYYRDGGTVTLSEQSSHPLVFVLNGTMTVDGKWNNRTLPKGSLMAVNQKKIRKCTCGAGTIVVEYLSSPRFVAFLDRCSDAFDASFSQLIPISPLLYEWFDKEFAIRRPEQMSSDDLCAQRKSFATVMTSYPQHVLQELYVCFFACSTGDCKHCDNNLPFESK